MANVQYYFVKQTTSKWTQNIFKFYELKEIFAKNYISSKFFPKKKFELEIGDRSRIFV